MPVKPLRRTEPQTSGVEIGSPVAAQAWRDAGQLANWINGTGTMLVPMTFPGIGIADGSSATLEFRVQSRGRALSRRWTILAKSASGGVDSQVPGTLVQLEVQTPAAATAAAYAIPSDVQGMAPIVHVEDLASKSGSAEQTIDIRLTAVNDDLVIYGIGCFELDRSELAADATDSGVEAGSLRARAPIRDVDNASAPGLVDAYDVASPRRGSLFQWAVDETDAASFASSTFADLFAVAPTVQARRASPSSANTTIRVAVLAQCSTGTGEVRFTSAEAGDSATLTISSASFAWVTAALDVLADDMTQPGALASGPTWESVAIEARKLVSGSLDIKSISIFEDA
jgi:hypothetical protein